MTEGNTRFSGLSGNTPLPLTDAPLAGIPVLKVSLSRAGVFRREIFRKPIHVSFGAATLFAYLLREKDEILMVSSFFEALRHKEVRRVPFLREG